MQVPWQLVYIHSLVGTRGNKLSSPSLGPVFSDNSHNVRYQAKSFWVRHPNKPKPLYTVDRWHRLVTAEEAKRVFNSSSCGLMLVHSSTASIWSLIVWCVVACSLICLLVLHLFYLFFYYAFTHVPSITLNCAPLPQHGKRGLALLLTHWDPRES